MWDIRPVVDYRPVNEIVVDNRNPIPCIDEIMNKDVFDRCENIYEND